MNWRYWLPTLAAGLLLACGGSGSANNPTPPASLSPSGSPTPPPKLLTFDAATKTVRLTLLAGQGGFAFNGHANGSLTITVPVDWKVSVTCTNVAAVNHSCAVVAGAGASTPAFPGAAVPNPTTGLGGGETASFAFTPSRQGHFRIACLVPGHEDSGMWDNFVVGPPTVSPSASPPS